MSYFGGFVQKHSFVHTLDARTKFLYVFIFSFFIFSTRSFLAFLIMSVSLIFAVAFSGIKFGYVMSHLRRFLFIFVFLFVMYFLFAHDKLFEGIIALWRFLLVILLSLVLTYTTPLSELTRAIEYFSFPLQVFGIKPRNIALMLSISIRFFPLLFFRLNRLRDALLARLGDFRKVAHLKLLVICLLDSMFESASTLTDAMSARLYNSDRVSSSVLHFGRRDYVSFLLLFVFIFAFFAVNKV